MICLYNTAQQAITLPLGEQFTNTHVRHQVIRLDDTWGITKQLGLNLQTYLNHVMDT